MAIPQNSKHCPAKIPNFHVTQKLLNCLFPNSVLHPISSLCCCTATEPRYTGNEEGQTEDAAAQYSAWVWTNLILVIVLLPVLHPNDFPWATFSLRFDEKIRSQAKKSKFSGRFAKRRKTNKQKKPPVAGQRTLRQQSKRSSTASAGVLRFLMCLSTGY